LGAMVEILSTMLPGGSFAAMRARRDPHAERYNVGHFFLAIDPCAFRQEGEFENDLDDMIDALHTMKRAEVDQPVLVHGELEQAHYAERSQHGIPISAELAGSIRAVAESCGAPYLLAGGPKSEV